MKSNLLLVLLELSTLYPIYTRSHSVLGLLHNKTDSQRNTYIHFVSSLKLSSKKVINKY